MAITINGSGTITGISAGGLPDGSVTAADIESSLDLSGKTVTLPSGTGGKLLKVDYHSWDTYQEISTTTSGGFSTCTDSSFTYTPVGANKLIVVCNPMVYAVDNYGGIALFKDGSIINASTAGGNRNTVHAHALWSSQILINNSHTFVVEIDLASTNAITLDLRVRNLYQAMTVRFNRAGTHASDPDDTYNVSSLSSITVYEVAA